MGGFFPRKRDVQLPLKNREDPSVRNVAFSIMLGALALLQVAVIAAELSNSRVQVAAVAAKSDVIDARHAVASTEERNSTTL